MKSITAKLILSAVGVTLALTATSPADAARKAKKRVETQVAANTKYRGTNLFPPGPLYAAGVYLGDDPDPNIRFQIWRDLSGRLGGDSN